MMAGHILETERLIVRNWRKDAHDADFLHKIMSNELARRFYPACKTRAESDTMLSDLVGRSTAGKIGWGVACLKSGEPVGFTGLYKVDFEADFTPAYETGWQYDPDHWGKGYATEAAAALIDHAFNDIGLEKVVAFAVPANTASTRVMERIGMRRIVGGDFAHPNVPDTHPHLSRHVLYEIRREDTA